jgi:hypothetical protein
MTSEKRDVHVWPTEDLVDQVDEYAKESGGISRAAVIAALLAEALGPG